MLSAFSKLLEKSVCSGLMVFIVGNEVLPDVEHGLGQTNPQNQQLKVHPAPLRLK
jgi:hypothetical protein